MRYNVYVGGEPIGGSDLEHADPGMGVATGRFVPAAGYAAVRAVFRGHAEAHAGDEYNPDMPRLRRMELTR